MTVKYYNVTLQADSRPFVLNLPAENIVQAINLATDAEGAPRSAVTKVELVEEKQL